MKQFNLFGAEASEGEKKYTATINAPVYQPNHAQPHILELFTDSKTKRLVREIEAADLPEAEKAFLLEAARRHTVFNYELIADYYSHASPLMQSLMERSALVIIDFEQAIQLGYVKLSEEIRSQYLEEYETE